MKIKSDMSSHAERGRANTNRFSQTPARSSRATENPALDDRSAAITAQRPQALADRSPRAAGLRQMREKIHHSPRMERWPGGFIQKKANDTGLPDALKSGMEALAAVAMDDVQVHYNSAKPAQLRALAYTQGTDIHVGPGQERHVAHEAWHVVQQKLGRVKPTMRAQGMPINDDARLEREADVMGAQALQMRRPAGGASEAVADTPGAVGNARTNKAPVVQRYTVAHGHRIANDHTAAVEIGVNNKLLYATPGQILASNQIMRRKQMPISLETGVQRDGLVDDQVLHAVTPKFEQPRSNMNFMTGDVSPQAGGAHQVVLPSECEKGAIAVIGAFTKTQRSAGNARVYHDKDHANARIGELLSQSTAAGVQKDTWYQDWVALDEGVDKATAAYNSHVYGVADMVLLFQRLNDPTLRQEFLSNFERNEADTAFEPTYIFDTRVKSRVLFEKITRAFDAKMAAIETAIMRTVDTGTVGEQAELIAASDLQRQLELFFANRDYDRAAIDQAIAMVPETIELQTALNQLLRLNQAGDKYESAIWFREQTRLREFTSRILETVGKHVVALTARNTKSLGAGSGLNAEVNPEIGQSYGIVGGNYNFSEGGRWNWHWAAVIMKAAGDNVTMEAHRSHRVGVETHNDRWDFKMYGTAAGGGQTFHDEWRDQGFGKAPVTVLGIAREAPTRQAEAHARGIDLLNDPQTQLAITAAENIFVFVLPLEDAKKTKAELMLAYQNGIGGMGPALGDLPAGFVAANIQGDWDNLVAAMNDLIGDMGTAEEQLNRTVDVNDAALDVKQEIQIFYQVAKNYQGHMRKRGVFL
ncbi:MAG: DUF4157 domain-containing protein [Pseudomonadota bacterium]